MEFSGAMLGSVVVMTLASMAGSSDTVSLSVRRGGAYGCTPGVVNVKLQHIVVTGQEGTKQTYHRAAADSLALTWALNSSQLLDAPDFPTCARLAGEKGFDAFSGAENCTGYRLHNEFCRCTGGDVAVYVREDFLGSADSVEPLADGVLHPSAPISVEGYALELDMLVLPTVNLFTGACPAVMPCNIFRPPSYDDLSLLVQFIAGYDNPFERKVVLLKKNVGWVVTDLPSFDLGSSRTASSCGLPALRRAGSLTPLTYVYFLEECGQTITLSDKTHVVVQSHRGFGSEFFPHDIEYDCTVHFQCPSCEIRVHQNYMEDDNSGCGGYSFMMFGPGDTEATNVCNVSALSVDPLAQAPVNHSVVFRGAPASARDVPGFVITMA